MSAAYCLLPVDGTHCLCCILYGLCIIYSVLLRKGKERKGKERKGKEEKGTERKGKERKGKHSKGKERKKKEMKGKEMKGKERMTRKLFWVGPCPTLL